MHSAQQSKAKLSGYIKRETLGFEIAIKYGDQNSFPTNWKEKVIASEDGQIISKQNTAGPTKLTSALILLNEETINQIIAAYEDQLEYPQSSLDFIITTENKLDAVRAQQYFGTIHSYYNSSSNPRPAQARKLPKRMHFKDIPVKAIKKAHPRVKYIEYSHKTDEHTHSHPVTLLQGDRLAKTLLLNHKDKSYKQALIDHITHTLKLKKSTPIIYQSLCVPEKDVVHLGLHGAEYILKHPEFFLMELDALKELQLVHGYNVIRLSIPNIKRADQVRAIKQILRERGITRSHKFNLLFNLQVPSTLFLLDEILNEGVDGVVFDFKKLSRLVLGMDTHILETTQKHYDPAILKALDTATHATQKRHTPLYLLMPEYEDKTIYDKIPESQNIHIIAHA